jgi:hypothetical protein
VTRPARLARTAALAVLSALALAGCGGGGGGDGDERAAEPSPAPSSSHASDEDPLAGAEEVSADDFGDVLAQAVDQASTANFKYYLSTAPRETARGTGQLDYRAESPSAGVTMKLNEERDLELVLTDGTLYLLEVAGSGKYLAYDREDSSVDRLRALIAPMELFAEFDSLVTRAQVDEVKVEDEPMHHYVTTVDMEAVAPELSAEELDASWPESVDFQWWFDDKGDLRRVEAGFGARHGGFEYEFADWGTPVQITAPPPGQVTLAPVTSDS